MTVEAPQISVRPILNSTEAQLFIRDLAASCDFYSEKLGFTLAFPYGDPPARFSLPIVKETRV